MKVMNGIYIMLMMKIMRFKGGFRFLTHHTIINIGYNGRGLAEGWASRQKCSN